MKAADDLEMEIKGLKLDIVDRLEAYDVNYKELCVYDDEIRDTAGMPPKRREARLNKLISKIRSNNKAVKRAEKA